MRIPRAWVEAYGASLDRLSERGRAELEARLAEVDWDRPVAEVRAQVVAIMDACCGASADVAARLAADFYDGLRERQGVSDGFEAEVEPCREPDATEGAVRAFAQDLVDGRPREQFVGKCSDRLDREVRLAANKCVEHNARRDPRRPRWARVPTGPETCEFCIMLASRGFAYHSEELASHAHANCDCRVVPSWDRKRAEVEGYDPDEYYRQWKLMEAYGAVASDRRVAQLLSSEEEIKALSAQTRALTEDMNGLTRRMKRTRGRAEYDRLRTQWDALNDRYQQASADLSKAQEAQSRIIRTLVGRIRTLGAEPGKTATDYFDLSGATPVVRKMVEDALPYVPRDWLDTLHAAGVKVKTIPERSKSRSYFDLGENAIYIKRSRDKLTVVHEMMHAMDENSRAFFDDSRDFFVRRTRGKQLKQLRRLEPGRKYRKDEMAYDMGGECVTPYAFKEYKDSSSGDYYSFEVASIGVEYIYRRPLAFLSDPDHLMFVLHKLAEV